MFWGVPPHRVRGEVANRMTDPSRALRVRPGYDTDRSRVVNGFEEFCDCETPLGGFVRCRIG